MNRTEIVWLMVRVTGFTMLALSLQVLPSLVTATDLALTLSKLAMYLIPALYLIGRGEGLIALLKTI